MHLSWKHLDVYTGLVHLSVRRFLCVSFRARVFYSLRVNSRVERALQSLSRAFSLLFFFFCFLLLEVFCFVLLLAVLCFFYVSPFVVVVIRVSHLQLPQTLWPRYTGGRLMAYTFVVRTLL